MSTSLSHHRPRPWNATRQAGSHLGRLATVLATVIAGLLASAVAATAAFAQPIPVGDGGTTPVAPVPASTVRVITTGGIAGWQIILIAVGAALAAAVAAVLLDRKVAVQRRATAATA